MFSGIVESKSTLTHAQNRLGVVEIHIKKPSHFNDLKPGDSICVNGVCLTLENSSEVDMSFSLAAETLQVTGWNTDNLVGKEVNLERSLKVADRIHGHLVTGHVDGMGSLEESHSFGESQTFAISYPPSLAKFLWAKGSVAVNGVSLTLNEVTEKWFTLCLIPETLKRTNLGMLKKGDAVTLEMDNMARGLVKQIELGLSGGLFRSLDTTSKMEASQ